MILRKTFSFKLLKNIIYFFCTYPITISKIFRNRLSLSLIFESYWCWSDFIEDGKNVFVLFRSYSAHVSLCHRGNMMEQDMHIIMLQELVRRNEID